ncbi:MAG: hypothetical protein QM627_12040 [Luteolibacter sp.]
MKLEGEYAVDKWQRAHRIVSGLLAFAVVGIVALDNLGLAFRVAAVYVLPLVCIWFSDRLEDYRGRLLNVLITESSPEKWLRWGGWFALLAVSGCILIVRFG